jgi:hydroxymethylpyrimidine pyrophosphatase-like HAD family hydrolase
MTPHGMLPLARLDAGAAAALQGICFDVDDTVTTHGVLDPEAYAALFSLRTAGLKLLAVTGRPLGFAEIIARTWPVDAAVGENGAGFLARTPQGLHAGYWDEPAVRRDQQARLARIQARVAAELPEVQVSSDAWARRCDLAFDVGEHAEVPAPRVDQLVRLIEEEGATASVSSIHAHAQLGAHDKARGIVRACAALWALDEAEVKAHFAFVGDSGNDAAAFAFFALTFGVANVARHLSRLPVPPLYVADAACGAGFAEIARAILSARG